MLVVMGPVLEVPVTDLFAAAIVPGLMLASLYAGYAMVRCAFNPALGPVLPPEERAESMTAVFVQFCQGLVPPAALSAYFLKGVVPEWDLKDIYVGMMPFMVLQVIGLLLIIFFPQIALWLPSVIYGE